MRHSALAYVPGNSPLHAASTGPAIAFLGSFALAGFVFAGPIMLASAGLALVLAGLLAGAGRAVRASLRYALTLALLIIAVNALVVHRGATILIRGDEVPLLGRMDVTLESLAAGAVLGLRIAVVMLAFAVYSACVDPDGVLRLLRPVARRSALTATLVARMVPVASADLARLREGAELRGPGATPVGRSALLRRLVAGSLDRAVDVAATLELRGHSLPGPPGRPRPSRGSLDDAPLLAAAGLVALVVVVGTAAGAGGFDPYPGLAVDLGVSTLALAAILPAYAAIPFAVRAARARRELGGALA